MTLTDRAPAAVGLSRREGLAGGRIVQYATLIITAVLVLAPFVPLLYQALLSGPLYDPTASLSLTNFQKLVVSAKFWTAFMNALLFGFGTALISQLFGTVFAVLVGRTDMPGVKWIGDFLIWPLFISHLVLALSWYTIYGPSGYLTLWLKGLIGVEPWNLYSISGMSVVGGVAQAPLAYLYCLAAINAADPALEDAARGAGARSWTVLRKITVPLLRPAILYGLVINFVIGMEMLSIPLIFGRAAKIQTFSTYLYDEALTKASPDYGLVAAASLVVLISVVALLLLQTRLVGHARRYVTVGGKATRPKRFQLGRMRWPLCIVTLLYMFFAVILPMGGLILRSVTEFLTPLVPFWEVMTAEHYDTLWTHQVFLNSIWNTLLISSAGGVIGTVLIVTISLVTHRSDFRFARHLDWLAQIPRALPGIFGGLAFLYLALSVPPIGWMRNTVWLLVLAYIVRYIPTGLGAVTPSLQQIGADLDASARSVGAGWIKTCRVILLPLLKPAMFSCFALLFILFMREYVTAVFLIAPGSEVIGTTLLQFWENGDNGPVAALATVQILITVIFVYLARKILGVKIYG
mgnify:CR=1 FL=1